VGVPDSSFIEVLIVGGGTSPKSPPAERSPISLHLSFAPGSYLQTLHRVSGQHKGANLIIVEIINIFPIIQHTTLHQAIA